MPDKVNLQIRLAQPTAQYQPGDLVKGTVTISNLRGAGRIKGIDLVLFWRTSGYGTKDEAVAQSEQILGEGSNVPPIISREFSLRLPPHPWSYSGKVIIITWYAGLYIRRSLRRGEELEIPLQVRPASSTAAPQAPYSTSNPQRQTY